MWKNVLFIYALFKPWDLCFCVEVLEQFSTQRSSLAGVLCPMDLQLVDEVHEYLALEGGIHDWSLGLAHLKALCKFCRIVSSHYCFWK